MKIHSFNVNGIRAILKKDFNDYVKSENPDVLCLQEIKAKREQVDEILVEYEYQYWNSAKRPGYSGVCVFSKIKPKTVLKGMGIDIHDSEGRILTLEFEKFYLVNVYTPNSKMELLRLDYRCNSWDSDFLKFIKNLEKKKPIVVCGDLNVAHNEIDIRNPNSNERNPGFTIEERESFSKYLDNGFIDTFRYLHPETIKYSWWSYRFRCREKNIGWRLDYFLISRVLVKYLKNSNILNEIYGSDHCPVEIKLDL
jgi:exodeoxyribonuclease III